MQIIKCNNDYPTHSLDKRTSEICSRHILVFGEELQKRIAELVIGVVCVGGIGSLLVEQLMRLFPGKIVYSDKDRIDFTNLNRFVGAIPIDARLNARKIDVASRNILSFNPNQQIYAIHGDFLKKVNQEQFTQCDFIFGASDSNAVRLATNRLCLAHGIPYLDCGSGAIVLDGHLKAAGGQVIKILPDSSFCLHCSDIIDVKSAMQEFLSKEERKRQEEQGYIRGAQIPAPQVYSLNMMVASWAIWFFKRMVSGEEFDFDGITIDAKDFQACPWKERSKKMNNCPTCGIHGIVFRGDGVDLLCREEGEVEIDVHTFTKNQSSRYDFEKTNSRTDTEFPVPIYPLLILGKDESTPFDLGSWIR